MIMFNKPYGTWNYKQMGIIAQFLIFSSSILIFFSIPAQSANTCKPESCGGDLGPTVRFPFRLKYRQPIQCEYPGFHLYCNAKRETIINLPQSGDFIVSSINYSAQAISIKDPGSCLPKRILNFNLSDSPFRVGYTSNYTFLNCSSSLTVYTSSFRLQPLRCLSGGNYTVFATIFDPYGVQTVPPNCQRVANVSIPIKWAVQPFYWPTTLIDEGGDLDLLWSDPACFNCENQGRVCGLKDASSLQIGCYKRPRTGLPRSAKYGIIVGVGIPGLVCIIGLVCYICSKIREFRHRNHLHSAHPSNTVADQNQSIRAIGGLDMPTIQSYPKTVLGESCRLPKPSEGTCPICLCEYQAKETLRTIPECNHYFHADCIDEWLKLNGTCPLCRNSPDSSLATPCSSMSLSSPSLSTASSDNP